MAITITDPGTKSQKPQHFTVTGTSDAADGSPVTCTISKGAFSQTGNGMVLGRTWFIPLGTPNPIPADSGYEITARLTSGGGSYGVEDVLISADPVIKILEIKSVEGVGGARILTIDGAVKADYPFDALHVLVYVYGKQKGARVASSGWIKPIPAKLNWAIKLEAPDKGHLVVHVLGVKTGENDRGVVVAHVTQAMK
jgi:hypothetical protein